MVPLPRVISAKMAGLPRARGSGSRQRSQGMAKYPALPRALLEALGKDYFKKK